MYYEDEIRQTEEFRTDIGLVKEKELEMAMSLIESLTAPFEPAKYKDNYRENLKSLIAAKVAGEETVEPAAPQRLAPVVDILEALKLSLAQSKKPPRSVNAAPASSTATEASGKVKKSKKG